MNCYGWMFRSMQQYYFTSPALVSAVSHLTHMADYNNSDTVQKHDQTKTSSSYLSTNVWPRNKLGSFNRMRWQLAAKYTIQYCFATLLFVQKLLQFSNRLNLIKVLTLWLSEKFSMMICYVLCTDVADIQSCSKICKGGLLQPKRNGISMFMRCGKQKKLNTINFLHH